MKTERIIVEINGRKVQLPPEITADWIAKARLLETMDCYYCGASGEFNIFHSVREEGNNVHMEARRVCSACYNNVYQGSN